MATLSSAAVMRMVFPSGKRDSVALAEGQELVERIKASPQWHRAGDWGEPRPGHPEGTVGRHVLEQVIPFIDRWYRELPDYWNLIALGYLHDIGKPVTRYESGHLSGESHSILSARMAADLGAPERLVQIILSNDRAYSYWRKLLDQRGVWTRSRWSDERRRSFVEEFGRGELDLALLVRFHRADNAYRRPQNGDESTDSVIWFEQQLLQEGLVRELPPEGKDQILNWNF